MCTLIRARSRRFLRYEKLADLGHVPDGVQISAIRQITGVDFIPDVAVARAKIALGIQEIETQVVSRHETTDFVEGAIDAFGHLRIVIEGRVYLAEGLKLTGMALALLFGTLFFGFIPQGFDGPEDPAVGRFDGRRRKPDPFASCPQTGEKAFRLEGVLDQSRLPPVVSVECLQLGFPGLIQNDIGQ